MAITGPSWPCQIATKHQTKQNNQKKATNLSLIEENSISNFS